MNINARGIVVHPFPAFFRQKRVQNLMFNMLEKYKQNGPMITIENLERRRLGPFYLSPYCIRSVDALNSFVAEKNYYITLIYTSIPLGLE